MSVDALLREGQREHGKVDAQRGPPLADHDTLRSAMAVWLGSWPARTLLLLTCVLGAFAAALALGQDANWDLQNYHFYDPWAWLEGRIFDHDLAAAQLQTFHNPLADVPFYLLVAANVDPRIVTFWLALPTGVAAYCFLRIAWAVFADLTTLERIGATVAAAAIGFTGAMGVGQLGSTTNEWLVSALVMASLALLVPIANGGAGSHWSRRALLAGVIAGMASGLKLTAAPYAVGLCVALLARRARISRNVRAASLYALGVVAGLIVMFGPWSHALWTRFGNPIFPYANQWFRSPWWDAQPVLARRFGPHAVGQWLLFPFKLLSPRAGFVSEVAYTDARLPVLYALALVAALAWLLARIRRQLVPLPASFRATSSLWRFIGVAFIASFVVWGVLHAILRYTIPLEILSGVLIVALLGYLLRPQVAGAAVVLAVIGIVSTTAWSDWGRVRFGPTWFDVRAPELEPGALVLLTADAPMSFVLPYLAHDARHVGIRNNINDPGRHNRLEQAIAAVIREDRGPLYALSYPPHQGEDALRAHGLQRVVGGCSEIRSNMPTSPIEICRLARVPGP